MKSVDVTAVSPFCTNNQPPVVVGEMADDADLRKYSKNMQSCDEAGQDFQASAVDVYSVKAEKSLGLMRSTRFVDL